MYVKREGGRWYLVHHEDFGAMSLEQCILFTLGDRNISAYRYRIADAFKGNSVVLGYFNLV